MRKSLLLLLLPLFFSCSEKAGKNTIVGIQAYNNFPKSKADTIAKTISAVYGVKTIILPARKLDKNSFIKVKSPRYRADSIIRFQKQRLKNTIDFVIGLTDRDISTTKYDANGEMLLPAYKYEDWGVMGLGYCPGKSCLVSTFRIKSKNERIHYTRLKKVAVHEFGHNLGLPHCPDKKCVMTDAVERISTIDNARLALCKKCSAKIH